MKQAEVDFFKISSQFLTHFFQVKMKEDKEAKEAARERERKRQTVVTPGGQGYATPKRTPQRFGL